MFLLYSRAILWAFCLFSLDSWATASVKKQQPAVFVYGSASDQLVFALNVVENGDLYLHLSGPAKRSWVSVGIGEEMEGSLMFVAYSNVNGTGVTISPRIADGHSEPSFQSSIDLERLDLESVTSNQESVQGDTFVVDATCRNCSSWTGGSLDLTNSQHPFIFAMGPAEELNSDNMEANLKRHTLYGDFTMDIAHALSSAGHGQVPRPNGNNGTFVLSNATGAEDVQSDSDIGLIAHAVIMCIAFIIIMPLGALVLRVLGSVIWHGWVQALAYVFVILGAGTGAYISLEYNKSKMFNSAHQVIGIIVLLGLVIQLVLGYTHHQSFKKYHQATKRSKIHLVLGPAMIIVGLVNGGLGFNFADDSHLKIAYIVVVIVVATLFFACRLITHFLTNRSKSTAQTTNHIPLDSIYHARSNDSHAVLVTTNPDTGS